MNTEILEDYFCNLDSLSVFVIQSYGDDYMPYKSARLSYGADDHPSKIRQKSFIKKLLVNKHMVPFEHCGLTLEIYAPIFVFRQLFRYRTSAISEMSMRYSEASPMFYIPSNISKDDREKYKKSVSYSYQCYTDLNIPREQCRAVLPLCIFSRCFFTINLRNLMHILDQRLDKHAQLETRQVASLMLTSASAIFPITMRCYKEINNLIKKGSMYETK